MKLPATGVGWPCVIVGAMAAVVNHRFVMAHARAQEHTGNQTPYGTESVGSTHVPPPLFVKQPLNPSLAAFNQKRATMQGGDQKDSKS